MELLRSTGIEDPHSTIYGCGACHIHALAAARVHGGTQFLIVENHEEQVWVNSEDPDDYIPAVIHVYSLHEVSGEVVARDILGDRLIQHAEEEAASVFAARETSSWIGSVCELLELTQGHEADHVLADGGENPLCAASEAAIQEAMSEPSVLAEISKPVLEEIQP
jgi:hypothetical protein